MRPLALAPVALLASLAFLSPLAAAQEAPTLTASLTTPSPVPPGGDGNVTLTVQYCYSATSGTPAASVDVAVGSLAAWLKVTPEPASFRGETSGQKCGSKDVLVRLSAGRDAPAFDPKIVKLTITSHGSTSTQNTEVQVPVQADYRAELRIKTPPPIQVRASDSATLQLSVGIGANAGTNLEVTGSEAKNQLNVQGFSGAIAGAGNGLDQVVTQTLALTISASPGASVGAHTLRFNLVAKAANNPSFLGGNATLDVPLTVTANGGTPAAPLGLVVLGIVGLALVQARRRR